MAGTATVTLIGNLGGEPVTEITPGGVTRLKFSMAVNTRRGDGEVTNWYRVTAFGKLAESLDKLAQMGGMAKGRQVYVQGRLEAREYTDKNGVLRTSLDVTAQEVVAVGPRGENGGGSPAENLDEVPW